MKLNLKSAGVSMQTFGTSAAAMSTQVSGAFSKLSASAMNVFSKLMMWTAILSVIYMLGKLLLNFFNKPS